MHIMKKSFFILTALTLILSVNVSFARNVSVDEAKTAAMLFMNNAGSGMKADLSDINLIHQIDNPELNIPACYFFNVSDWGWVIVSASTTMDPIIGYNDNGHTLNMERVPANMMWWVESFAGLISAKQVEDASSPLKDDEGWAELLDNYSPKSAAKANHILMSEEWGQGGNDGDTYNIYCPRYQGVPTIVGCVATALSQIVHYYQFPVRGQGYKSYFWNNPDLHMSNVAIRMRFDTVYFNYSLMPNSISSSTPVANRREISKLCYAIGVGMNMTYGTNASGGSGAVSANVPGVMNAYFKYRTCTQVYRENTTTENFINLIRGELLLNRPVYMSGASPTHVGNDDRHAWVCCGYKDSTTFANYKKYYMNWGWESEGNGYYNLYDNTSNGMRIQSQGYSFINEQSAMIGLIPPHPDSSAIDFWDHLSITDVESAQLQAAYPNPATHSVTIPYSIKNAEVMSIYSIKGELVEQLTLTPGDNKVVVSTDNMPSGIYIYRIGGATSKFVVR